MKRLTTLLLALSLISLCMNAIEGSAALLDNRIDSLSKEFKKTNKDVADKLTTLQEQNTALQAKIDSFETNIAAVKTSLNGTINEVNNTLGTQIEKMDDSFSRNNERQKNSINALYINIAVGFVVVLLIVVILYTILKKRIGKDSTDIAAVKEANKKLEEQSVALDTRLADMLERQLKTDESMKAISANVAADDELDHSLILSIANEMARIDQNLTHMDPKTKGVSQLRNRSKAISQALAAKGYTIASLVGTEYKEGANMEVEMEEDESIEVGKMIVRRVLRPCVLYNGKMIQAAKVVVAFNPEDE